MSPISDPVDLSHLYSNATLAIERNKFKQFYKYFSIPGIGQLAGGLPNSACFPFDTLEANIAQPNRFPTEEDTADTSAASHISVPRSQDGIPVKKRIDIATALQYGTAQGYPPLFSFLKKFTLKHMHPFIPYKGGADIVLCCGSTDGFAKVLQCFSNEWSVNQNAISTREGILTEDLVYMPPIMAARYKGLNVTTVARDNDGIVANGPGGLRNVLSSWDYRHGRRPHLLYSVAIGNNPTGTTTSMERKKEIYAVCCQYDVIIVEDEPYWYLQYPSARDLDDPLPEIPVHSSGFQFIDSLTPSYLSIDVEGRVVRLDTFSKTIAPGCRLGWITAAPQVIERLIRITELTTQQPSGFVQSMVASLITGSNRTDPSDVQSDMDNWNMNGWVRWLMGLRTEYEARMNRMCDVLDKYRTTVQTITLNIDSDYDSNPSLSSSFVSVPKQEASSCSAPVADTWSMIEKTTILDFVRPTGGMFVWIEVMFENHPLHPRVNSDCLSAALWVFATHEPHRVLMLPGEIFYPDDSVARERGHSHFRLCFAAVPLDDVAVITQRLCNALVKFWQILSVEKINELIHEYRSNGTKPLQAQQRDMSSIFC